MPVRRGRKAFRALLREAFPGLSDGGTAGRRRGGVTAATARIPPAIRLTGAGHLDNRVAGSYSDTRLEKSTTSSDPEPAHTDLIDNDPISRVFAVSGMRTLGRCHR